MDAVLSFPFSSGQSLYQLHYFVTKCKLTILIVPESRPFVRDVCCIERYYRNQAADCTQPIYN